MAGLNGKDMLVYISDDGTATGTMNPVECQGTLNLSFNKSRNTREFKNCSHTSISAGYLSGTFEIGFETPTPTAHLDIWDHHDNTTQAYMEIRASTGALQWVGFFKIYVQDATFDDAGNPATANVEFAQDGTVTRSVTA